MVVVVVMMMMVMMVMMDDDEGDEGDHLYSPARLARRPLCVALCHSSSFANFSPDRPRSSAVAMHKTCPSRGFKINNLIDVHESFNRTLSLAVISILILMAWMV